jgi:MFS family permease
MTLKNIPTQVFFLGMISFFTDCASEMLYPVTPLFLASLGASMMTIGIIEGIAEVTAGLLKGYFGALSDRVGKRSIFIVLGYGLSGLVKPLPGIFPHIATVVFSRTTDRIGKGMRTAPRDALLASHAHGNTGAIFGFHRGMDTLGAVVGPLTALVLLSFFPQQYALIFLLTLLPSVGAVLFCLKVEDPAQTGRVHKETRYREFWRQASFQYKVLLVLVTVFSLAAGSSVFLVLKAKEICHSDMLALLGYVFYNLVYALSSYPIGILADRCGKKNVFLVGLFVFALVYLGFAVNQSFVLMWVLFACYGIYSACTEGITKAWVADLTPEQFRGSAIGLLTTLSSLAAMLGSVLTGTLWDSFNSSLPFYLSAFVAGFIACLLLLVKRWTKV